ncbi:MAG: UTP--glucose-1-phosphate uridylyltransferase, partial [Alphaproteobacteria bacterium]|nr:UTP--glucose-1-phosphate uridylyltransferase [Alphaproteobacteria bacterium]
IGEMVEAYDRGHMVATMTVAPEDVSKYGVLAVTGHDGRITHAHGMVEKPAASEAPSRKAVIGRYVLDADIFDALETQAPGAGGEIQLTDAIAKRAQERPISGFSFSGTRFDCGSKSGMLEATLHLAEQDPELADVLYAYAGAHTRTQSAA